MWILDVEEEKQREASENKCLRQGGHDLTGTEMTATSQHRIPMPMAIVIFFICSRTEDLKGPERKCIELHEGVALRLSIVASDRFRKSPLRQI